MVAVSADGSTAVVGAAHENSAWVFTRVGATWIQQGPRLTPEPDFEGLFGASAALSANGNLALISSVPSDSCGKYESGPCGYPGAVWVFARTGSTWVRQGTRLDGQEGFGSDLAITGDGLTALIGAPLENGSGGGSAVLASVAAPHTVFSAGPLLISRTGTIRQKIASSQTGTLTASATASARALRKLPKLRCQRRRPRRCQHEKNVSYGKATAYTAQQASSPSSSTPPPESEQRSLGIDPSNCPSKSPSRSRRAAARRRQHSTRRSSFAPGKAAPIPSPSELRAPGRPKARAAAPTFCGGG